MVTGHIAKGLYARAAHRDRDPVAAAGSLIPSIQSISRQSLVTADFGNLRSLQSAHYQYAVDSKGRFADAGLSHGGLANEKIAWLNTLGEYVDIKGVIRSPLDTSPHWEMPIDGTTNRFRRTSYGWNNYLSRTKSPDAAINPKSAADRLSRISNPSTVHFLHMVATGDLPARIVHVELWISDAMPDAPILAANHVQTNVVSGEAKTTSAKANYGFVDGSFKHCISATSSSARSQSIRSRWRNVFHSTERRGFDDCI